MTKHHLKRLAVPTSWPVKKKGQRFAPRPMAGPHNNEMSVPASILLRHMTKHAKTLKEVKYILTHKTFKVDGRKRKETKFPVGLFDVVTLEELKEHYRVVLGTDGLLSTIAIDAKEAAVKPCKITAKTVAPGGKMQLNLSDGKNVLVKDAKAHKVGDTVLVTTDKPEVKEHLPLKKGSLVFFTGGKQIGTMGKVEDIQQTVIIFSRDGNTFRTKKKYAFVIGKDKPTIKLTE